MALLPASVSSLFRRPSGFPDGVKYAFHYGEATAENPTIRFDNHHGPHELHLDSTTFEIEYPGVAPLYRAWRAALPPEKRVDWPL